MGRVILYTGNFGEVFNLEGSLLFSLAGWVKRSWFQYPNTQCMVYLSTLTIAISQMQIIIHVYTIQLSGWDILEIPNNYYQSNILETIEPSILEDTGSMKWWLLWEGEAYTKQMMSICSVYTCRHKCILKYTLWKFNRLPLNICHPKKKTIMKSWHFLSSCLLRRGRCCWLEEVNFVCPGK